MLKRNADCLPKKRLPIWVRRCPMLSVPTHARSWRGSEGAIQPAPNAWRMSDARTGGGKGTRSIVRDDGGLGMSIDAPEGYGSSSYVGDCEPELDGTEPLEAVLRKIARRAETVLSNVQDVVAETTRDARPRIRPLTRAGGGGGTLLGLFAHDSRTPCPPLE